MRLSDNGPVTEANREETVERFHRLYYDDAESGGTWQATHWLGRPALKCPLDLWIYQEMVQELRPDVIVETGTFLGGTALFLASICDLVGHGRVVTIDIEPQAGVPSHDRITYLHGSSTSPEVLGQVREALGDGTLMAILDSDHHAEHVLEELRAYAPLVPVGSYLIAEDTNINGNPVLPDWGPGPREAVETFLGETDSFAVDESKEKFFMTFNPGGYLKRVR
jgi:cephalosporin hydroxylase